MPKFLIGNYGTGLETDLEPWLIPQDAFSSLNNMYVWRGRVRRQPGYQLRGQLVETQATVNGNTDANGEFGTVLTSPVTRKSVIAIITEGIAPFRVYTYTDDGLGNLIVDAPTSTITNITQTNPAVVSSAAHPFTNGDLVRITSVSGMLEVNNANYTVSSAALNDFEINFDGTTASPYVNDGDVNWVGTINYATGSLTLSSNLLTQPVVINFTTTPCLPVMGLSTRETDTINFEQLIAFDTRHANLYSNTLNQFTDISAGTTWNGTNSDFFWTTNFARDGSNNRLFWATNNVEADGIKYYDGTVWTTQVAQLTDPGGSDLQLVTCLIIIPYRNRLVCLNTLEGPGGGPNNRSPNRARWSQLGTPVTALDANAWRQDIEGRGAALDAPTSESIVSAEFVRDTLIVFFERSTYRLAYTGSETQPFQWEKINTELGAESTFSVVPFDNGIFAVGDKGVITANSSAVGRIDEKIPDVVFQIENEMEGPQRVHGIRDFRKELVYWTYPPFQRNDGPVIATFPNKLLVYNYKDGSYSFFSGSFTTLGTLQVSQDRTWASSRFSWASSRFPWNDPINQARYPLVVAGNQQGFVFSLEENIQNSECLKIDNITQGVPAEVTSTNHNFDIGEVIEFTDVQGMTEINGRRAIVRNVINANEFSINDLDENEMQVGFDTTGFGAYTAGGFLICIFGFLAKTKRFNPFIGEDLQMTIPYMDLYLDNTGTENDTTFGEFTLKAYVDSNQSQSLPNLMTGENNFRVATSASQTDLGTISQQQIIQRVFVNAGGQFIQFEFTLDNPQLFNDVIQTSDVTIHAMILTAEPYGRLV